MGTFQDRMRDDLTLLNLSPKTRSTYLYRMKAFVAHYMRPPTDLGEQETRGFLLHLLRVKRLKPATVKVYAAAIKFFYTHTLPRPEVVVSILLPKVGKQLPIVLSGTEIATILDAVTSPICHAVLTTIYATGMRVTKACELTIDDLDSKRGVIFVPSAKGDRDRYVTLSPALLKALREYWRKVRPQGSCLFPGRDPQRPIAAQTVRDALRKAAEAAGVNKRVTPHVLRHSYATHLHELGVDIRTIQTLLGHASIRTTTRYTQISRKVIAETPSPLDALGSDEGSALG